MTEALSRPAWHLALILGAYATLVAFRPVAAVPLLLLPLCWWTLIPPGRWIVMFLCAAIVLPPLPIPLGDSGPHICLLFAALGLLSGLLRLTEWRLRRDALTCALALFFFVLLFSVSIAAFYSGPSIAAGTLIRVLLFGISVYVFFYVACGPAGDDFTRPLFAAAVISALFACVDFYFQFPAPAGFGPQFVWLDTGVYRRAQGFFYEASTLGNFCTFFLVFVAVCFTSKSDERPVPRIWLACGTIVFSLALVLSYSRASIGNLAIALFVLLLRRKILRVARLLFLLPLAGLVSYVVFPVFTRLYWERLWASTVYFFSYTEGIFSGRFASWRAIGDFLLRNPLSAILGVGYKTLPYSDVMGRPVVADNMYLSLLVETGIVGLAAMLFLNVAILRAAARSAKHSFFGEWIFCFWIGQIFQMLSGDLLTYWRVMPVYFWVLAMAVRRSREDSLPRSV